jgi:hypothetical protein
VSGEQAVRLSLEFESGSRTSWTLLRIRPLSVTVLTPTMLTSNTATDRALLACLFLARISSLSKSRCDSLTISSFSMSFVAFPRKTEKFLSSLAIILTREAFPSPSAAAAASSSSKSELGVGLRERTAAMKGWSLSE